MVRIWTTLSPNAVCTIRIKWKKKINQRYVSSNLEKAIKSLLYTVAAGRSSAHQLTANSVFQPFIAGHLAYCGFKSFAAKICESKTGD